MSPLKAPQGLAVRIASFPKSQADRRTPIQLADPGIYDPAVIPSLRKTSLIALGYHRALSEFARLLGPKLQTNLLGESFTARILVNSVERRERTMREDGPRERAMLG